MTRFLVRSILIVLANAIGLLVASLLLSDFNVKIMGFIVSVLFFTVAQLLFEPFIMKMAERYAPALRGGIALVSIFIGLVLTETFTSGLRISGVTTWLLAPLIIWVAVVVAGIVLPTVLFKDITQEDGRHTSKKK